MLSCPFYMLSMNICELGRQALGTYAARAMLDQLVPNLNQSLAWIPNIYLALMAYHAFAFCPVDRQAQCRPRLLTR